TPVAETAGRAILDVRARGFETFTKTDASPVTEADRIAEGLVTADIESLDPRLPIVAEERMADGLVPRFDERYFWLHDALEGTTEFVKGGMDFTVNIALIWNGLPILGIVHAPARGETYLGIVDPAGACRRAEVQRGGAITPISARRRPTRVVVTGSKSHEV